jgi:hypothetical protein
MYLELAENGDSQVSPYISVPTENGLIQVREDQFDSLPRNEWNALMNKLAPFQTGAGLSEDIQLGDKATRERRKEARTSKKEAKVKEKESKTERKELKQQSKADKRANRKPIDIGGIIDSAGKVIGNITGKGDTGADMVDTGAGAGADAGTGAGMPKWIIPVGIGAVVLVGAYFLLKKK